MSEIVLASDDAAFEGRLRAAFAGSLNGHLTRVGDLNAEHLLAEDPSVIALGPSWSSAEMLALAAEIDHRRPEITVLLFAEPTAELWELALRSGARDLIAPDALDDEMVSAIERARERSNRQQRNVRAVVASQPPAPVVDTGAKVIVVVSPKGGSGKTMLSTNLAYGLAQRHPGTVALVDLDVQFGDVGTALRLNAQYSIAEAVHNPTDPIHVKSYLTPHDAGFWVLGAPANPIDADDVKPEAVKLVLETLRLEFDWLVIDTGAGVDDHTLTALELASQVILVATTDVAAIHGVRKLVDVLDQLNFPAERQVVVLNRANARVGLSVEDIERTVGRRVEGRIPSARVVPTSMNLGSAILEDNARSNVGRAINDLIDDLDPGDAGGDGASRWSLFGAGRS